MPVKETTNAMPTSRATTAPIFGLTFMMCCLRDSRFARRPEFSPRLSVGQSVRGISVRGISARARGKRTGALRRRATSQRPCLGRVEAVSRIHASLDGIAPSILPPVLAVVSPGAIDDLVPVVDRILSLVLRLFLFLLRFFLLLFAILVAAFPLSPARGRSAGCSASPTPSRMLVD